MKPSNSVLCFDVSNLNILLPQSRVIERMHGCNVTKAIFVNHFLYIVRAVAILSAPMLDIIFVDKDSNAQQGNEYIKIINN